MNNKLLRIGTRESQLAVWQANQVKNLLEQFDCNSELVFIKSEGDIDLHTPLYEIGIQGIFTKSLDIALLNNKIDIAVHSLKDVPTQLPLGLIQSAVLQRANYKDVLVLKEKNKNIPEQLLEANLVKTIATSSIRRKAQWLHKYPNDTIVNLRGNVNTRLQKIGESNWLGAIFAAAGLERLNLLPDNSIMLDWMLPAPAQGAISVVCRSDDEFTYNTCQLFNHKETELCTNIEKAFLKTLLGGCSTPVSALAEVVDDMVYFKGNIFSVDGKHRVDIEKKTTVNQSDNLGVLAAQELLDNGGKAIADEIQNAR